MTKIGKNVGHELPTNPPTCQINLGYDHKKDSCELCKKEAGKKFFFASGNWIKEYDMDKRQKELDRFMKVWRRQQKRRK